MTESFSDMCIKCKTHFLVTCIIMAGLLTLIILLDYYKLQKKKKLIGTFAGILVGLSCVILGLTVLDTITLLQNSTDFGTYYAIIIIGILTGVIVIISLLTIIVLERLRNYSTKKSLYTVLFSTIAIMGILLITAVILITFVFPGPIGSLHLGSIIGFPALFLLSVGTILVIFDEPKLVIYHGLTAGGSWVLTTLNVLLLFTLSEAQMTYYSGILHTFHILCGAVGLICGFLSALFGISGQRKLAKLTGYITLGCWWTAYMVSIFVAGD